MLVGAGPDVAALSNWVNVGWTVTIKGESGAKLAGGRACAVVASDVGRTGYVVGSLRVNSFETVDQELCVVGSLRVVCFETVDQE